MAINNFFEFLNYYYNYGWNGKGTTLLLWDGTHLGYAMNEAIKYVINDDKVSKDLTLINVKS
jgi:hypothetical protein